MLSELQYTLNSEADRLDAKFRTALARLADACEEARQIMAEANLFLERLEGPAAGFPAIIGAAAQEIGRAMDGDAIPHWDRKLRVLSLGGRIVKQFRVPSANQAAVFDAFQREGWPRRIDDPLDYRAGRDSKYRLHFTINRMNQSQQHRLIRFFGDGTGEGVCWEAAKTVVLSRPAAILQTDRRAA